MMNILHLLHVLFLGFFDPPPAQRKHVFSTENKQKLAFSDPLSPPTSADVIYEWSLKKATKFEKHFSIFLTLGA